MDKKGKKSGKVTETETDTAKYPFWALNWTARRLNDWRRAQRT
jgi:hypothetical protein